MTALLQLSRLLLICGQLRIKELLYEVCSYDVINHLIYFLFQRLMYIADMEHSGKKLHCIYEQRDDNGNNLFEGNQDDEDEVRIIVRYLEQPTDELETLPSAEVKTF